MSVLYRQSHLHPQYAAGSFLALSFSESEASTLAAAEASLVELRRRPMTHWQSLQERS